MEATHPERLLKQLEEARAQVLADGLHVPREALRLPQHVHDGGDVETSRDPARPAQLLIHILKIET